jgi:serine/threonine protein kinase
VLKFLGQGAFGKVYLARRTETRDLYALKIIKLRENCSEDDLETIKNEH